jgi:uncharacterized protein YpiB (UPF0302 family)
MFEDFKPIEHSEEELLSAARVRSQKINEIRQLEAVIRPVYVFKNYKGDIFITEEEEASAIVYNQVQRIRVKHEYLGKTDNREYLEDLKKIRHKVETAKEEAKSIQNMSDRINRMVEIDDNRKKAFAVLLERLAARADKTKYPPSPRKFIGGNATLDQIKNSGLSL